MLAADERRVRREPRAAPTRLRASIARQTGIGSALPFAATGSSGSKRDRALGRAHRRLVDDHGADRRRRLQARGRVDDVAGDDALAALRTRPERDDGLARRHGGAHGELETLAPQLLDRLEDPERRSERRARRRPRARRARRRRP